MESEISEIISRETEAWDTKDVDLLLSIFHSDMVWPMPKSNKDFDPESWRIKLGKFDYSRWFDFYSKFFSSNNLLRNNRSIVSIKISEQLDAAIAVVDIDTLWENNESHEQMHWLGRTSKTFVKTTEGWKLIMHTGPFKYS